MDELSGRGIECERDWEPESPRSGVAGSGSSSSDAVAGRLDAEMWVGCGSLSDGQPVVRGESAAWEASMAHVRHLSGNSNAPKSLVVHMRRLFSELR